MGDDGFCGELCDCDDDCLYPGFVCEVFDPTSAAEFGRSGSCSPATDGSGTQVPHIVCN
jgi:hypothetical protein